MGIIHYLATNCCQQQRLSRGFSNDANGNQITAPNGLTITYNSINQPQQVKSGSTVKHKFAYLADGRKLLSLDDIKSNQHHRQGKR